MPSMVNAVAMTTVSTPLISPSFVVPSSLAVSSFCVALRWWFTAKAMSESERRDTQAAHLHGEDEHGLAESGPMRRRIDDGDATRRNRGDRGEERW